MQETQATPLQQKVGENFGKRSGDNTLGPSKRSGRKIYKNGDIVYPDVVKKMTANPKLIGLSYRVR